MVPSALLTVAVATASPNIFAVSDPISPIPDTLKVACHPPETPPRHPDMQAASTPSERTTKGMLTGAEAGVTEVEDTERAVSPVEVVAGVVAVKEVVWSFDQRRAMPPKGAVPPRRISSSEGNVTAGRKVAVMVTSVPPAAVAVEGSTEVIAGVCGCMVTDATKGEGGSRASVAVPAGEGGRLTVTERDEDVECTRSREGRGVEARATPVTERVRSDEAATMTPGFVIVRIMSQAT